MVITIVILRTYLISSVQSLVKQPVGAVTDTRVEKRRSFCSKSEILGEWKTT